MWKCKCDCGMEKIIWGQDLRNERIKSCGCSTKEMISQSARKEPYWWIYYKLQFVAKRTKRPFNLSFQDFLQFTKIHTCYYCNCLVIWNPHFNKEVKYSGYNIDRKDNSKGYTKTNCVVCCSLCNHIKGNLLTESEMLRLGIVVGEIQEERKHLQDYKYSPAG